MRLQQRRLILTPTMLNHLRLQHIYLHFESYLIVGLAQVNQLTLEKQYMLSVIHSLYHAYWCTGDSRPLHQRAGNLIAKAWIFHLQHQRSYTQEDVSVTTIPLIVIRCSYGYVAYCMVLCMTHDHWHRKFYWVWFLMKFIVTGGIESIFHHFLHSYQ